MKHLMRKCSACGAYTLSHACSKCGGATVDPHPPKYSPDDRYVRYRVAERYSEQPASGEEKGDKD
jgi:H/ACA ribonucleoprotein complex subunit 3